MKKTLAIAMVLILCLLIAIPTMAEGTVEPIYPLLDVSKQALDAGSYAATLHYDCYTIEDNQTLNGAEIDANRKYIFLRRD